jgi:HPt (histidine-containing phosphotransfer) domain-containing protein
VDADRRFHPGHVLEIAGGEPAFLRELAAVLRASASRQFGGLRAAVAASDRAEIMRLAHQLKGGLGTFGDARLNARANALEAMALTAPAEGLTALLDGLEADIAWLGRCLDALAELASPPAPDDALTVVDTSGP